MGLQTATPTTLTQLALSATPENGDLARTPAVRIRARPVPVVVMLAAAALLALAALHDRLDDHEDDVEAGHKAEHRHQCWRLHGLGGCHQAKQSADQFHHKVLVLKQRETNCADDSYYYALGKQAVEHLSPSR